MFSFRVSCKGLILTSSFVPNDSLDFSPELLLQGKSSGNARVHEFWSVDVLVPVVVLFLFELDLYSVISGGDGGAVEFE